MSILWTRVALNRLQNVSRLARHYGHASKMESTRIAADRWKKLTLYLCIPTLVACSIHVYLAEKEHFSHPRPEFKPYDHLRIRSKPFPWGDGNHTLFHHPVYNALPGGYEAPDPNEHKKHEHH